MASALSEEKHQGKGQGRGNGSSAMFGQRGTAAATMLSSLPPHPGVHGKETSSSSSTSEVLKWFDIEYSQTSVSGSLSTVGMNNASMPSSAIRLTSNQSHYKFSYPYYPNPSPLLLIMSITAIITIVTLSITSTTIIEELQNSVVFKAHDYDSSEADVSLSQSHHRVAREGSNHSSLRASADSNDDIGTEERNTSFAHLHVSPAGTDPNQGQDQSQHQRQRIHKASTHISVSKPQVLLRMQVVPLTSPALDLDPRAHLRMNKKTDHRLARDVEASLALQQLLRPTSKGRMTALY